MMQKPDDQAARQRLDSLYQEISTKARDQQTVETRSFVKKLAEAIRAVAPDAAIFQTPDDRVLRCLGQLLTLDDLGSLQALYDCQVCGEKHAYRIPNAEQFALYLNTEAAIKNECKKSPCSPADQTIIELLTSLNTNIERMTEAIKRWR